MANSASAQPSPAPAGADGETRRDFLLYSTVAFGAVGTAMMVWPLIDSMNPAADTLALSTTEFNLSGVQEGQGVVIIWRGKPVFVRYRTQKEIDDARAVALADLIDPAKDEDRVQKDQDKYLILVGVCTHLGCIPLGSKAMETRGEYGGWFCPCHGSHYDTSGRIRKGPAPANLEVPPYTFISDTTVRIG
ncbi:MAG: ubiquinol-cytochrome c reductase iron-sulfur subunit [Alphaproteobacteria bacterium]|nr:ubiquinol-cytochrome c reductase iron-sulfur subunit [Alphaproteobacteria bacterium]